MNALYKNIHWEHVEYVGFDLDGTLYDEYEFIVQPYKIVSTLFKEPSIVFSFMSCRWLEKGSSYNKIFGETYDRYSNYLLNIAANRDEFIAMSLDIYRAYTPALTLPARTQKALTSFMEQYTMFLVTDGNPVLQDKKFRALRLERYFDNKHVCFTGENPAVYEKPKCASVNSLKIKPQKAVFFGDRDVDKSYAIGAGMQFQPVYNMLPL